MTDIKQIKNFDFVGEWERVTPFLDTVEVKDAIKQGVLGFIENQLYLFEEIATDTWINENPDHASYEATVEHKANGDVEIWVGEDSDFPLTGKIYEYSQMHYKPGELPGRYGRSSPLSDYIERL